MNETARPRRRIARPLAGTIVLAVLAATGCSSSSGATDAGTGADRGETSVAEQADQTTVAEPATTTSAVEQTTVATSAAPAAPVAVGDGYEQLFTNAATFGIAFDALNIELSEEFSFARIDITQGGLKFANLDGASAFVTQPHPDVLLGGWVEDDAVVSSAAIVSPFATAASLSAVLTLMAVTIDDTDANIDAVNQALVDIDASGLGGSEYLIFDGRGVLFEVVEIDGAPHLSAVVSKESTPTEAAESAAVIRTAMIDRIASS